GAPGSPDTPGKAFLFARGTGSLLLALANPLATAGDEFGFAVAAAGTGLLIGAPGDHAGAGRVFLFDSATGALIRSFAKPTSRAGDRFGASIAVTEAGLLVGAPSDGDLAPAGGAAYLFDLETGALRAVLRKEDSRPEDLFGTAVAGQGSRVLVGAPGDDVGLVDGGAAYVFSGAALEAVFRKRLSALAFGASVAAAGADVLVGAPRGASGAGRGPRLSPRRRHRRAGRDLREADPGGGRLLRRGRRGRWRRGAGGRAVGQRGSPERRRGLPLPPRHGDAGARLPEPGARPWRP